MSSEENISKAKDAIRYKLLRVYESRGLDASLKMSNEFLLDAASVGKELGINDFGKMIRGELSELYAELCLREYVKKHSGSFYVKSLCFKRTDDKEGYTELDLTLFTKQFILLLECKSYSGEKTLTNEGCMNVKGRTSYNVFSQSRMHLTNLDSYVRRHKIQTLKEGGKPYILAMFSYSKDAIEDLRNDNWKKKFPLLTENNIEEFLSDINKNNVIWDINKLFKLVSAMNKNSASNKEKHIALSKKNNE